MRAVFEIGGSLKLDGTIRSVFYSFVEARGASHASTQVLSIASVYPVKETISTLLQAYPRRRRCHAGRKVRIPAVQSQVQRDVGDLLEELFFSYLQSARASVSMKRLCMMHLLHHQRSSGYLILSPRNYRRPLAGLENVEK